MRVQIVIAGTLGAEDTEQLLNSAYSVSAPDRVIVTIDLGNEAIVNFWERFNPEVLAMVEAGNSRSGGRCGNIIQGFTDLNFDCVPISYSIFPGRFGGLFETVKAISTQGINYIHRLHVHKHQNNTMCQIQARQHLSAVKSLL